MRKISVFLFCCLLIRGNIKTPKLILDEGFPFRFSDISWMSMVVDAITTLKVSSSSLSDSSLSFDLCHIIYVLHLLVKLDLGRTLKSRTRVR